MRKNGAFRFRSSTLSHADSGNVANGSPQVAPALLTRMCTLVLPLAHGRGQPEALRLGGEVGRDRTTCLRTAELRDGGVPGLGLARADVDAGAGLEQPPGHHQADPRVPPVTTATLPVRSNRSTGTSVGRPGVRTPSAVSSEGRQVHRPGGRPTRRDLAPGVRRAARPRDGAATTGAHERGGRAGSTGRDKGGGGEGGGGVGQRRGAQAAADAVQQDSSRSALTTPPTGRGTRRGGRPTCCRGTGGGGPRSRGVNAALAPPPTGEPLMILNVSDSDHGARRRAAAEPAGVGTRRTAPDVSASGHDPTTPGPWAPPARSAGCAP